MINICLTKSVIIWKRLELNLSKKLFQSVSLWTHKAEKLSLLSKEKMKSKMSLILFYLLSEEVPKPSKSDCKKSVLKQPKTERFLLQMMIKHQLIIFTQLVMYVMEDLNWHQLPLWQADSLLQDYSITKLNLWAIDMFPLPFLLQLNMDVVDIQNKKLEKFLEIKILLLMEVLSNLWNGTWIMKEKMIAMQSWLPIKTMEEESSVSIMLDPTLVKLLKALLHWCLKELQSKTLTELWVSILLLLRYNFYLIKGIHHIDSDRWFCKREKTRMLRMSNFALLGYDGSVFEVSEESIENLLRKILSE